MNTLQQLSSGNECFAGLDEDDSTWNEKCLDDRFDNRLSYSQTAGHQ